MLILWDKNGKIQKGNNLNNLVQISDFNFFKFKQQYKALFIYIIKKKHAFLAVCPSVRQHFTFFVIS